MAGRRPLSQGRQVSASDYESIAKAIFGAYGTNGVDLRIVAGRLQASGSTPAESTWWNVRVKPGDTSKLQVSGGFVQLNNGGSSAYYAGGGATIGLYSHGSTGGNPTYWTDVTPLAVGDGNSGSIYVVQYACHPYNSMVFSCDIDDAVSSGAYPSGEYEWRRVGTYTQASTGVYTNARRTFFGGSDIVIDVVPAGTLRLFASGAPPPGWRILDGSGTSVNAGGMGVLMNSPAALLASLDAAVDTTVSAPAAYHATDKISNVAVVMAVKL